MRRGAGRGSAFVVPAALFLIGGGMLASPGAADSERTQFEGSDDFLFDPSIPIGALLGSIECVNGQATGNPLEPCTEGSRVRLRGALLGRSAVVTDDPRFSGIATTTANAELDTEYAGQIWGRWRLDVDDEAGRWEGFWTGKRTFMPASELGGPAWITEVRYFGSGAGSVEGLRVSAEETAITFTPLPIPYEALLYFGFPGACPGGVCPPEGFLEGTVWATGPDR